MDQVENPDRTFRFRPLSDLEIFNEAERLMKQENRYLDHGLTMESLAAELNVHRNSFSRAVNTFAGTSFSDWLASYRVSEAERLAAAEKQPLEKLASRAGFPSRTSFYRAFRKIKHNSPSAYLGQKAENSARKQD